MATDAFDRKFSILFDWFDRTEDGWLTHEDFEVMAGLFMAVAHPEDHENRAALREAFGRWWEILRDAGGTDEEGRVGRQPFIDLMRSHVTDPKTFEHVVLQIVDALMQALDTDRDGVLTTDEYVRMYEALHIPPETSGPAFQRLDLDGDGVISHAEFRKAIEEFYLSPDPDAPGNWLLGSPLGG
ncbi:EF-hand domain-containing protein [Streptomyces chrestomyceticus]|uniref:EF-hand domain-containing protein n=1 Tax=Streptomyces chrestomyceticus TaxID=68185 RepID=UPI0019D0D2D2|nr:EF-hand domain-containing protein [Streptomyces chrestomyceticus]